MNNELTHVRFSQGQNNKFQRNNIGPYNNNNYIHNYNHNFARNNNTRNNNNVGNNSGGNNFNNSFQRQNRQWNTCLNNRSIPTDNNVQYVDMNQYDDNQNASNSDGSCYNGNKDMTQNQQENDNVPPVQFNAMLLDSYDST